MNELSNEETAKTDRIYHGCYMRNADGTTVVIDFMNGEPCLIPTAKKYWKNPEELRRNHPQGLKKNQTLLKQKQPKIKIFKIKFTIISDFFLKQNKTIIKQCI